MPRKPRPSPKAHRDLPLDVALKVVPRTVAVGAPDVLLSLTVKNLSHEDVRDVEIRWEIPAGFADEPAPTTPPPPAYRRSRGGADDRPGTRGRAQRPAPPPSLTAPSTRALSADRVQLIRSIAAEATSQGFLPLRPARPGRFTIRILTLAWTDARGKRHAIEPDVSAAFTVEEAVPPRFALSARCTGDAALGEPVAVELLVRNEGNLPAREVALSFALPAGVGAVAPAEIGARSLSVGPFDVGGGRAHRVPVRILPEGPGPVSLEDVQLSYTDIEGARHQLHLPPIPLQVMVRVDPGRVFVGRDQDRAELSRLLESVALPNAASSSRVVLVAGGAGIGKSRLVEEIKTRARLGGYLVADARCSGPTAHESTAVLRSLIGSLLELGPLLSTAEELDTPAMESHLKALGRALPTALARGLPALVRHLRPAHAAPATPAASVAMADPAGFFTDLVRHLTRMQPLLLAVDDIHWMSPDERRMLARLLVGTRDCRIVATLTYREEEMQRIQEFLNQLHGECGATRIRLGALNYEACRALITENFAGANFPDWLVRAIHTRSRGLPLYEVEALRCLVQDGVVRFDPSHGWKADEARVAAAMRDLPGTPKGLVARQIAALRSEHASAYHVLQDAAVLHTHATLDVLTRMSGMERAAVEEAVHLLVLRGILREVPTPGAAVEFAHPLKREVALPGPLEEQERHHAAAQAIAAVSPEGSAGAVASHLMAAGRKAEAFQWYLRHARHAQDSGAPGEGLAAYEEAARLFEDPEVAAFNADVDWTQVVRSLLTLLMERGSARRSLEVAERLQELAAQACDGALESEAALARARSLSRLGRDLEALQAFYAAMDLSEEAGRAELAVTASLELSEHYRDRDREEPARRVVRNAAERFMGLPAGPHPDLDPVALVAALCRADCLDEARAVWDTAFASAVSGDDEIVLGAPTDATTDEVEKLKALRARSFVVAYTEGEDAVAFYLENCIQAWATSRGRSPSLEVDGPRQLEGAPDDEAASWLETLCRALWLSGNTARALEMLDASWSRRGRDTSLRHRARYLADRANLLAALERGREAAAHSAEYVQVARGLGEPHLICDALLNAAYLALAGGDTAAAEASLNEGMTMARERSLPSLMCRAQLLMAGLEMARGHAEEAVAWCRQGRRLAEDHGLSPELVAWATTELARCRAAMGDLAGAAAECGQEGERLAHDANPSYALSCLRAQAGYLLEQGDLQAARAALEKAVALPAGRPGGGREREQALRELAETLLRLGDLDAAVVHIQECLQLRARAVSARAADPAEWHFDRTNSAASSVEHLATLCERLQIMGQGHASRDLLQRALQSLPAEDVVGVALAILALARLDALEGDPKRAFDLLERALRHLGPARRKPGKGGLAPEERRRRRARVLVRTEMGRVDAMLERYARARKTLESALKEARLVDDLEVIHGVLGVLGRVLEELDHFDEARAAWEEITRSAERSLSSAARMEAFMGLARGAVSQDRLEEAAEQVQAAENAALEAGWVGVAMMGEVAEAWEVLGFADRSLALMERAITIVRLSGVEDRARLPEMLQIVARLLCQVDPPRYRDAVRAAEEAIEISRQVGDPNGLAENLEGMAHILIMAGEEPRAIEQFHAALHLYDRVGQGPGAGRVHGHLARLHLQTGDMDSARAHLDEALRLGTQVRQTAPEVLADALFTAATLEHEQGHLGETTTYLLAYLDLGLAASDLGVLVTALRGLQDQPPGYDLSRLSEQQWEVMEQVLAEAAPSDEVVECLLAGSTALEDEEVRDIWLDKALHAARQTAPSRMDPATLDELARALEKRGDFLDAANVYRALAAREEPEEPEADLEEMRAYACGRAAELLTHGGQVAESLQLYYEAERHAEKAKSPMKDPGIAWNAFAIASIHLDEGRAKEATRWFQVAAERWIALLDAGEGELEERFNFMAMLSLAQALAGAPGDALATLERFRARMEQESAQSTETWVGAACDLAEALVRQNQFDAAHYALNEALAYLDRCNAPELYCRVRTMLSWVAADRKDMAAALEYSKQSLARIGEVADPTVALQAWLQAATLYAWIRDGAEAARCHREVIELATQHHDWKLVLEHRESLVLALAGSGDLQGAAEAWDELKGARTEAKEQVPDLEVARPQFALATICLKAGDATLAASLLQQDVDALSGDEGKHPEDAAFLLSWLGTARHQSGALEGALEAMRRAVAIVKEHLKDDPRAAERGFSDDSLASVFLEMTEVLAKLGRWDEAAASLTEAEARAAADPWVGRRLPGFREAVPGRRMPPHADPMEM